MEFPEGITDDMPPAEAMTFLGRFLDGRPDDDRLCAAALTIVEPLIDWHWAVVEDNFIALMRERPELRKIVSCCDFDDRVPEAVRERLYSFVRPQDDIGHQPAAEPDDDRPPKGLVTIAPELTQQLREAPAEEVARIVRRACEIAVQSSGVASADADAALALLAGEWDESARTGLIDRLGAEHDRLDDESLPLIAEPGPEADRSDRSFRMARAYEALRFAIDTSLPDFGDRAVFSAAFATGDRPGFLAALLRGETR